LYLDVEADETANNRMIIDDPSAQKLSHEEIEELKSQSLNGLVSAEVSCLISKKNPSILFAHSYKKTYVDSFSCPLLECYKEFSGG